MAPDKTHLSHHHTTIDVFLLSDFSSLKQWNRQNSIPTNPPARRPTPSLSRRPLQISTLHLNRSLPLNIPPLPTPLIAPPTLQPPRTLKTFPLSNPCNPSPRPRSPGAHPPLPSPRRNQTIQRRTTHNRQHRLKLPRRDGRAPCQIRTGATTPPASKSKQLDCHSWRATRAPG